MKAAEDTRLSVEEAKRTAAEEARLAVEEAKRRAAERVDIKVDQKKYQEEFIQQDLFEESKDDGRLSRSQANNTP